MQSTYFLNRFMYEVTKAFYCFKCWWMLEIVNKFSTAYNAYYAQRCDFLFGHCEDFFNYFKQFGCHFDLFKISKSDRLVTQINKMRCAHFSHIFRKYDQIRSEQIFGWDLVFFPCICEGDVWQKFKFYFAPIWFKCFHYNVFEKTYS